MGARRRSHDDHRVVSRPHTGAIFYAWNLATAASCARIEWPLAGRARPSAMALSADGALLVAGSSSGAMACWDVSQIVA